MNEKVDIIMKMNIALNDLKEHGVRRRAQKFKIKKKV